MEYNSKRISSAIKQWQKKNNIRQQDMADMLGVTIGCVSQYISGAARIGRNTAHQWSEAFGFNEAFLITGEGSLFKTDSPTPPPAEDIVIPAALAQMFTDMAATIRSQQEQLRAQSQPKNKVEDNKMIG